jgi:lipopolysaccharide/colanic/teichoic acid biosynthesis glycosyltransferase
MFRCYKFRTMVVGADQALRVVLLASPDLAREFEREFKLRRDPRVTLVGRFLRRTSLDELPQFWNVFKGDMSVVGWRPLVPDEIPRYGADFPLVAALRPGITGLWQVSGRNDVSYEERVQLDVRYAHEAGLARDLGILGRTVSQMARWSGNGAY